MGAKKTFQNALGKRHGLVVECLSSTSEAGPGFILSTKKKKMKKIILKCLLVTRYFLRRKVLSYFQHFPSVSDADLVCGVWPADNSVLCHQDLCLGRVVLRKMSEESAYTHKGS